MAALDADRGRRPPPEGRPGDRHRPGRRGEKKLIEDAYRFGPGPGLDVWCCDQAGPFQTMPHPGASWQPAGHPARLPHGYVRNGTAKVLTLFHPADGKVRPGSENSDGTPRPKKGDEIPVFGRLVALADVYDALGSRRAYKERWDEAQVLEELRACSGTHFDPEMVETLFSCLETVRNISERYPDH